MGLKENISLVLSHHPRCSRFDDHVIKIFGLRICLGCTSAALGMILSILLFERVFLFFGNEPFYILMFGGSLLLASFFLIDVYSRLVHVARKAMLGFGVLFYYVGALMFHWIFVAAFVVSIPLYAFVSIKKHKEVCKGCKLAPMSSECYEV